MLIALIVVVTVALTACSQPLEFPDWTIPVPEGTRIVEYPDVSDEERDGNHIELVEDLVIAARGDDDNYALFQPSEVLVDGAGRIYAFDSGNHRIQVYDANGEYVHSLGQAGSGPGEFSGPPGWITVFTVVAGQRVIAFDYAQARLSTWSTEGEFLGDHAVTGFRITGMLAGLADGSFVAQGPRNTDEGSFDRVVAVSAEGELLLEYVNLRQAGTIALGDAGIRLPNYAGTPQFAAASDGTVYASMGDEYQVLASRPDGSASWALRVAHEREPFTRDDRARVLDEMRERVPELDAGGTDWPTHLGAIGRLTVDGHGHLYVFGIIPPLTDPPDVVAVDVYAADGERLFAGTMPRVRWTDAAGDFVYATRRNPQTEEDEPVRYRLVEPFAR